VILNKIQEKLTFLVSIIFVCNAYCQSVNYEVLEWKKAINLIKAGQIINNKKIIGKVQLKDLANEKGIINYKICSFPKKIKNKKF